MPILPSGYDDEVFARPPVCAFVWGDFEFMGFVENLDVDFLVFTPEGIPKRAMVTIEMKGRAMSGDLSSVDDFIDETYTPKSVTGGSSLSSPGETEAIALLTSSGEAD